MQVEIQPRFRVSYESRDARWSKIIRKRLKIHHSVFSLLALDKLFFFFLITITLFTSNKMT